MTQYEHARDRYAEYGVDTDAALDALKRYPISLHCWQVDDVGGFERPDAALSGGGISAGHVIPILPLRSLPNARRLARHC